MKESVVLSALTAQRHDPSFAQHLYNEVFDEMMDKVFREKEAGVEFWYYIYDVPVKWHRDVEDYQFYRQKECCRELCALAGKMGLHARSLQNQTKVFLSWHEKHVRVHAAAQQMQKTAPVVQPWPAARTTTRAKIQLLGGKANLHSNVQRLASFFMK